jgi:HPt (histidine-containing phosphotransfer) domain-containing protein
MTSSEVELNEPTWNQAEFVERIENERDLVREILTKFKEDLMRTIGSLEAAASSRDLKHSGSLSHALKGKLSNPGGAGARQEQLACAGEIAGLRSAFGTLEREAGRLLPKVDAYVGEVRR